MAPKCLPQFLFKHAPDHPEFKRPLAAPRVSETWSFTELAIARGFCDANLAPLNKVPGGGRIAILELGGGWTQADLDEMQKLENLPGPFVVKDVSVDGTTNNSKDPTQDASVEVLLDIYAAAIAYCRMTGFMPAEITVLWGQDMNQIAEYAVANGFDVFSMSWGASEKSWGQADAQAMEATLAAGTAAGMVSFAAAGDNSSSDGSAGANVDLPAGCPACIAAGGTSWPNGSPPSPTTEAVWGNGNPRAPGTGGGYSTFFPVNASIQVGAPPGPGWMVPTVSDVADPQTGVNMVVNGQVQTIGGTSFVAPWLAGFCAAFGTKLGDIRTKLWSTPAAFKDIKNGSNGQYDARVGPDPCTGLGAVNTGALVNLLLGPVTTPPVPTTTTTPSPVTFPTTTTVSPVPPPPPPAPNSTTGVLTGTAKGTIAAKGVHPEQEVTLILQGTVVTPVTTTTTPTPGDAVLDPAVSTHVIDLAKYNEDPLMQARAGRRIERRANRVGATFSMTGSVITVTQAQARAINWANLLAFITQILNLLAGLGILAESHPDDVPE